ncbi:MAG TPA: MBL fold metallo-hydrolase [Steroidobacteraceae bacterium]|nr:MBL fold metallo-hydrolase [Steroidobacteraceae bacterium]
MSFLGAAGSVTGSCYQLELADQRLLLDCGLFQGYKQLRLRNWEPRVEAPERLGAVILTHAHIDHSGYLPLLVRLGFKGPIYCSAGTLELCRILLPDSGYLQEEEAAFANRHGLSRHKPALPLYTRADAEACLSLLEPVAIGSTFEPVAGVTVQLRGAGHLLGAAFARIEYEGLSLTFSGDLGRPTDPVLKAPAVPLPTDYLITESTYGDRRHPQIDAQGELAAWISKACARGGVTLIPAFAVGRAQTLLLYIARLKERKQIPDIPVYLDSPMAVDASGIYGRLGSEHRLTQDECNKMCRAAVFVNTPSESKTLDTRSGPMIILSASGMATGGRVVHHLKAFVGDPRNLVLLAGFQAPGTRGAALADHVESIRIHGEAFPVRAEVGQLAASSSHADADELLAWMRQLPKPPRCTFVTHGEPQASDVLRYRIQHELGWRVRVPEYRERVDLDREVTSETRDR